MMFKIPKKPRQHIKATEIREMWKRLSKAIEQTTYMTFYGFSNEIQSNPPSTLVPDNHNQGQDPEEQVHDQDNLRTRQDRGRILRERQPPSRLQVPSDHD